MSIPHQPSTEQSVWTQVDQYFTVQLTDPDDLLTATLDAQTAAGLPAQNVSPLQGQLLALLAQIQGARRILEIGSLGGYSTLWLARTLPADGHLVALELHEDRAVLVRSSLERAGLAGQTEVYTGPAADSLQRLVQEGQEPFDLIFLDADKPGYAHYLTLCLPLMRPGSVLVADNVVRRGHVADPLTTDENARGIQRFVEALKTHPQLNATAVQTVGEKGHDGFILARISGNPGDRLAP